MTAVEHPSHRLAAAEPPAERPRFRGDIEGLRAFAVVLVIAFNRDRLVRPNLFLTLLTLLALSSLMVSDPISRSSRARAMKAGAS